MSKCGEIGFYDVSLSYIPFIGTSISYTINYDRFPMGKVIEDFKKLKEQCNVVDTKEKEDETNTNQ